MLKNFLKTSTILSLAICAILLLVACNNNDTSSNGSANNNNNSSNNDDTASATRTPVSITWRTVGEDCMMRAHLERFVPLFETDNPDIEIVLEPIAASEGDYFARIALALQSPDTAPNVVSQDTFQINADASAGFLLALDEYLDDWEEMEHFVPALLQGVTAADGNIYAIPATTDTRGLWHDREVLNQAGIATPWEPASWEDVLNAAEAVRDNVPDAVPLAFNVATANGEATTMQTFLMLLHGTGEVLFDFDESAWVIESQGFYDSLEFIYEVFNVRNLGPSMGIAMNSNYGSVIYQEMFPAGLVGIGLDGFWQANNWREDGVAPIENVEERIGFAAMPTQFGQGLGSVTLAGGWGWSIPAHSTEHEASLRVIKALSTYEHNVHRVNHGGNITVRSDVAQNPEYQARAFIREATDWLDMAIFRPAMDEYPTISVEIQTIVEAVASGAATPEQAMANFGDAVIRIVGEDNVIRR